MIRIKVPPFEVFDEATNRFIKQDKEITLIMENSLLAISKWESKYEKPYFPKNYNPNPYVKKEEENRTFEETLYFIKCMVLNYDVEELDDTIFLGLSEENWKKITDYLQKKCSATDIVPESSKKKDKRKRDLTSEVIYAWMAETQIPFSAETWNINRLLNCIQVVNEDNTPDDKKKKKNNMPSADSYQRMKEWSKINEQRLKEYGTKG